MILKQTNKNNNNHNNPLGKLRIEGEFLSLIKDIYEKPTANIFLNG